MKIKFRVELEDMVAWNRYHSEHSPSIMRRRTLGVWGGAAALLLFSAVLSFNQKSPATLVCSVPVTIVYVLLIKHLQKTTPDKIVKGMYGEGSNKAIFGTHELDAGEQGIVESTEVGKQEIYYKGIDRVVVTERLALIYLSSVQAFVVPRNKVIEGDLDSFMAAIQAKIGKSPA